MESVETDVIHGFHAHINFDPETRDTAVALREEIGRRFEVELGRVWDKPVGPHLKPMYQVAFAPEEFAGIVPWLMVNHQGLAIFIHPETGDDLADHCDNALWLNEKLGVNADALRQVRQNSRDAAAVMIGEKGADMILGKAPLPPADAPLSAA